MKRSEVLRKSLLIFTGGASYGAVASILKLSYQEGFSFAEVICGQLVCAWIVLLLYTGFEAIKSGLTPLTKSEIVKLVLLGFVNFGTTCTYATSLTYLPASVSITLLFQFVWIGMVIDAVISRRKPAPILVASALLVFGGTLLASGVTTGLSGQLHPVGVALGLMSAVFSATFFYCSGHTATHVPAGQRTFLITTGGLICGLVLCPHFFPSGVMMQGLAPYAFILGFLAMVIPVYLFSWGTPGLPGGLVTIMASSELPLSILFSIILLHESVSPLRLCGVAIILGGVCVSQLGSVKFEG